MRGDFLEVSLRSRPGNGAQSRTGLDCPKTKADRSEISAWWTCSGLVGLGIGEHRAREAVYAIDFTGRGDWI